MSVGSRSVPGRQTDSEGRFFTFDLSGLEPDTEHTLGLADAAGTALCDAWPLRTFPAPDSAPGHFRLLVYTCAGGPDFGVRWISFLPLALRQRLLARALSFGPDAAVANGDHVYWDLQSRSGRFMGRSPWAWWTAGLFDRGQPILGGDNESVLKRAFGPQIADLYGVRFRSLPTFFLQDDHDYSENDEGSDELRTFPADDFMLELARTTQRLYYPELLADSTLPGAHVRSDGVSESYGRIRYGRTFEALLYDCRRGLTNQTDPGFDHRHSAFVPLDIERWITTRVARSSAAHIVQMPSTPILWSAGKWGEWYPDVHDADGVLSTELAKPYWARGWAGQHDRLVRAASQRSDRLPIFVSGDLHAIAAGRIHATNGESLAANPVVSVLAGPIGTGELGWPSRFRGQLPVPSDTVVAEEMISPIEELGFSLLDFSAEELRVSLFRWSPEQGPDAIDRLSPFRELVFERPA